MATATMTKPPATTNDLGKLQAELADLERDRQECQANLDKTHADAQAALVAQDMPAIESAWAKEAEYQRRLQSFAAERERLTMALRASITSELEAHRHGEEERLAALGARERETASAVGTALSSAETSSRQLQHLTTATDRSPKAYDAALVARAGEVGVDVPPLPSAPPVPKRPRLGQAVIDLTTPDDDVSPDALQALPPAHQRTLRAVAWALLRMRVDWMPGGVGSYAVRRAKLDGMVDGLWIDACQQAATLYRADEHQVREAGRWLLLGPRPTDSNELT